MGEYGTEQTDRVTRIALKQLRAERLAEDARFEPHRINYGCLFPGKSFKADCSCGWSYEGAHEAVQEAVREHEKLIPAE